MRKAIKTLQICFAVIVLSSSIFANTALNTCSCALPPGPRESLEHATAVFAGKVININVLSGTSISSADPVEVTFEVSQIWKGPNYRTLAVITAINGVSCGFSFKQNKEYIVYAYGEENGLSTTICSRTKLLTNAQEDLKELGEGNLPSSSGSNKVH